MYVSQLPYCENNFRRFCCCIFETNYDEFHFINIQKYLKWSEVIAAGQNLRSISIQAGLQLLNVLVTLTMSHRSFNYDTDHGRVWTTLGDWHCGLETFMLGSRSEPMQSSITACSTGQSANHLHHRGDLSHEQYDLCTMRSSAYCKYLRQKLNLNVYFGSTFMLFHLLFHSVRDYKIHAFRMLHDVNLYDDALLNDSTMYDAVLHCIILQWIIMCYTIWFCIA